MQTPRYPSLYQINTRVWLTELSRALGKTATLDDIPDAELNRIRGLGFDWVWFMSLWQTGAASRQVSRTNPDWRREFQNTLPDLREDDIIGSGFAVTSYTASRALGGDEALARLRERLRSRGLRLMLDFVPNHVALDHPWVQEHPGYLMAGIEAELARQPQNYTRVKRQQGDLVLAYGRDPNFPGWPDTLQLNYADPALQEAMIGELLRVATKCDAARCDMAMLLLPDVFERTWGVRPQPFWPKAVERVRGRFPDFCLMAEVYWDLEWTIQHQGFDYAYDKRLYDRLRAGQAHAVRDHLGAGLDYQDKLARFLENHDEPRAAATFKPGMHEAAAVITYLSPGLRFFQQGQFEGKKIRISAHLGRAPEEPVNQQIEQFYNKLLAVLRKPALRDGDWRLLACHPAWEGNWTWDCLIAFAWQGRAGERFIVGVNYGANQSQCYVQLPFSDLAGGKWRFEDQTGGESYDRDGNDLRAHGFYLDVQPWHYGIYSLKRT